METLVNYAVLGATATGGGGGISFIVMIVVLGAMMYFMVLRPQKKQTNQRKEMMSGIKKGDHVITIGRLHGIIDEVNETDKTFVMDCDGIFLTFDLRAVAEVKPAQPAVAAAPEQIEDKTAESTDETKTEEPGAEEKPVTDEAKAVEEAKTDDAEQKDSEAQPKD